VLIGLDVGTTTCKAVAHDEDGRALAAFQWPTPWTPVATGAELAPSALASVCLDLLRDSARVRAGAEVVAVGITSIAEAGVVLAADGRPVAPIMAWHDERGVTDAADLRMAFGAAFHGRTALPLSHVQSISKYRWLRRHQPPPTEAAPDHG
jgi:sugar (pentulose or hexulose) kinase